MTPNTMTKQTMFDSALRAAKDNAFQAGYKAYGERKGTLDNPYTKTHSLHESWYSGWLKADRDNRN